jgi:hypothetical protein
MCDAMLYQKVKIRFRNVAEESLFVLFASFDDSAKGRNRLGWLFGLPVIKLRK